MKEAAVEICTMQAVDVSAVAALAAGLSEAPAWPVEVYRAALDPAATVRRVALVARLNGVLVGFAVASIIAPEAELESIAVATCAQRLRVGRRLLAELCSKSGQLGVGEFHLEVRASNQSAIGFYRATGWRQVGERKRYYADPVEDALLFSLSLD